MKIAHIIAYYQPQVGYQETYLANTQKEMGHDVFVITSNRFHPGIYSNSQRFIPAGKYDEEGITVVRLKTIFEFGARPIIKGLKGTLREIHPDVVHCHDVFSFIPLHVAWLSKKLNIPLIYDSHASDINSDPRCTIRKRIAYALFRGFAGNIIKNQVYHFVAVGENELEFLCRELGLENKLSIIRLGAESRSFVFDSSARESIRKELSIKDDETVIVHSGKLSPSKNIEVLLEAIYELRKKRLNLKLLLIGRIDDEYRSSLFEFAKKLRLNHDIIFKGHVEREVLPFFYSASDIAVWPGDISIGAIEAMSVRLPLITPEDEYNKTLVKNDNGFLFEMGAVKGLAEKILLLASDSKLRSIMGMRSRELVEKELNWKTITRQFISLYRDAILEKR